MEPKCNPSHVMEPSNEVIQDHVRSLQNICFQDFSMKVQFLNIPYIGYPSLLEVFELGA